MQIHFFLLSVESECFPMYALELMFFSHTDNNFLCIFNVNFSIPLSSNLGAKVFLRMRFFILNGAKGPKKTNTEQISTTVQWFCLRFPYQHLNTFLGLHFPFSNAGREVWRIMKLCFTFFNLRLFFSGIILVTVSIFHIQSNKKAFYRVSFTEATRFAKSSLSKFVSINFSSNV